MKDLVLSTDDGERWQCNSRSHANGAFKGCRGAIQGASGTDGRRKTSRRKKERRERREMKKKRQRR